MVRFIRSLSFDTLVRSCLVVYHRIARTAPPLQPDEEHEPEEFLVRWSHVFFERLYEVTVPERFVGVVSDRENVGVVIQVHGVVLLVISPVLIDYESYRLIHPFYEVLVCVSEYLRPFYKAA